MPDDIPVKAAHEAAFRLRRDLADAIPESEIVVHLEPCARGCVYAAEGRECPYAAKPDSLPL
jgi:divalent metal cation (Fe/Co/Zn/Cd) transporter